MLPKPEINANLMGHTGLVALSHKRVCALFPLKTSDTMTLIINIMVKDFLLNFRHKNQDNICNKLSK